MKRMFPGAKPLVSVIMPMRNAEQYLVPALDSVLSQEDITLELVVVDDGSTDRSRSIVMQRNDPRIRVVDGPRRGFAASLNTGLEAAAGDIIMECDADDLCMPGRIKAQTEWLIQHDEFDALCGSIVMIDSSGRHVSRAESKLAIEPIEPIEDITNELRDGTVRTSFCAFAYRRRVFDRVGNLREYFETGPDIDFQLRLGEKCRVAYTSRCVYAYRLHESSITHTQANSRRLFFESAAYQFQRERRKGRADALSRGIPPTPPDGIDSAPSKAVNQIQGMLLGRAWAELNGGHRARSVSTAFRAMSLKPLDRVGWVTLAKVVLRATIVKRPSGRAPPEANRPASPGQRAGPAKLNDPMKVDTAPKGEDIGRESRSDDEQETPPHALSGAQGQDSAGGHSRRQDAG